MRLTLAIQHDGVRLLEAGEEMASDPLRLRRSTRESVSELHRLWRRGPLSSHAEQEAILASALVDAGQELSNDVFGGRVGSLVAARLRDATTSDERVTLGILAPELSQLPWEALWPGAAAEWPLALDPRVDLFREVTSAGRRRRALQPPLRVLVAIANPEPHNRPGLLINEEALTSRVLDAGERARQTGNVSFEILPEASLSEIAAGFDPAEERSTVLHLSCHAEPGRLLLETPEGEEDVVTAERLLRHLPLEYLSAIVLAGCSTGMADASSATAEPGEVALRGIAETLVRAGVPAVLAMQAPVSDTYATELLGELYSQLAGAETPNFLPALSEARRRTQRRSQESSKAAFEWATAALWLDPTAASPAQAKWGAALGGERVSPPSGQRPAIDRFLGRKQALRVARRALAANGAGLVVHGIAGIGKSALAGRLAATDDGDIIRVHGEVVARDLARKVGASLERPSSESGGVTVLLDDFDESLRLDGSTWTVSDPSLAELLQSLAATGNVKLLITSRSPFELPEGAHRRLAHQQLGPLSVAETVQLFWRFPALDRLSGDAQARVLEAIGGHPCTLERLNELLLQSGEIDLPGAELDRCIAQAASSAVAEARLTDLLAATGNVPLGRELAVRASVFRRPIDPEALLWQAANEATGAWQERVQRMGRAHGAFAAAMATSANPIELSFADVGLGDAEEAQYEADRTALERPPDSPPAGFDAALEVLLRCGLVAPATGAGPDRLVFHRWASPLLAELEPLRTLDAHQRAAGYWSRFRSGSDAEEKLAALIEARFHCHEARDPRTSAFLSLPLITSLSDRGEEDRAVAVCEETLDWLPARSDFSAALLHQVGVVAQRKRRFDVAERYLRRSLEAEEAIGNASGIAESFHQLGRLAQERDDPEGALAWYKRVLELGRGEDSNAATYHQLGTLAWEQGNYDEAERWTRRSLEVEERIGNAKGATDSRHQLGMMARARGDYDRAEELYEISLRHDQTVGNLAGAAASAIELGGLALDRGDFPQSEKWFSAALHLHELRQDPVGQAGAYHGLGGVSMMTFDFTTAAKRYSRAIEINERIGNQRDLANTFGDMGKLAQAQGDRDKALAYFERALRIDRSLGNHEGICVGLGQLGQMAMENHEPDSAERQLREALEIAQRIGSASRRFEMLGHLAALEFTRGNETKGIVYGLEALDIGIELAVPQIGFALHHLVAARKRIGNRSFVAIASKQCGHDRLAKIEDLMSQWERHLETHAKRSA